MVDELRKQHNDFIPGFAVVQVGNREDSNVYIRHKLKAAEEIGIQARLVRLDSSTTERQVCLQRTGVSRPHEGYPPPPIFLDFGTLPIERKNKNYKIYFYS
jgi:hypothetical protein